VISYVNIVTSVVGHAVMRKSMRIKPLIMRFHVMLHMEVFCGSNINSV
jgi:hypothetical protein